MRIAILGCGSMGTIMGAFFTKNGCDVDMVDSYEAHVKAMRQNGAHIIGTVDMTVPVRALDPGEMTGIYDLVFLFTKQNANPGVLPALLPHLDDNSTVCTLQNGVPEPDVASYVGQKRTVGGTVLWCGTFREPGVSELTQDLEKSGYLFEIGEMDGSVGERIKKVAKVLEHMGEVHVSTSLMASRWGKLINNACMSGMSAVCGCTFGEVLDNAAARACLSYLGHEVMQCCEADGYRLPTLLGGHSPDSLALEDQAMFEENQRMFISMYDVMRPAKASMLQDLEKGKRTEVNMINGYVCKTGRRHGIATPFNDAVRDIVLAIEDGKMKFGMKNVDEMKKLPFAFKLYEAQ